MYDSFELSSTDREIRNSRSGLWENHPATPAQQKLWFPSHAKRQRNARPTQADVLIEMLRRARNEGRALELPEIMAAGIAQHGARVKEIRDKGFVVENTIRRDASRRILSSYRLIHDPADASPESR